MLIFISGSVNAGKSTTAKLVAQKLGMEFLDFDEFHEKIPGFALGKDIPKVIQIGIDKINTIDSQGKSIVANYVVRQEDYEALKAGLLVEEQYFFTLAPRFEIAQSDRGRGLNDWETQRIKFHYDTGIASPKFGKIIDNSDLSIEQTATKIIEMVNTQGSLA